MHPFVWIFEIKGGAVGRPIQPDIARSVAMKTAGGSASKRARTERGEGNDSGRHLQTSRKPACVADASCR
jgi:hypothetical protein